MTATSTTVLRATGRELSEAEAAMLNPLDVFDRAGGEFTAAEVAVMQDAGYVVSMPSSDEDDGRRLDAAHHGDVLFQYGKGDAQFTGKLVDHSANEALVTVYRAKDGHRQLLRRDMLSFYLAKVDGKGKRVYLTRPAATRPTPTPTVPCPSEDSANCRMFYSRTQAKRHFEHRHQQEYADRQQDRVIATEERAEESMSRLVTLQEAQAKQSGVDLTRVPGMPVKLRESNLPTEKSSKRQILDYIAEYWESPDPLDPSKSPVTLWHHRASVIQLLNWMWPDMYPLEGGSE